MRRAALVWAVLFAAYAGTLGLDAFLASDYGGDEPHYLLAAKSLVEDGDLDVLDEYRAAGYAEFYPYPLDMHGRPTGGRLHEPHGAGFPYLIAPAFAAGGARGIELFLAALAALAMALAYLLARRVTPDPWALGATLAVGLSPPLVAYGSAVYPELAAGAVLAGAAVLALRACGPRGDRDTARRESGRRGSRIDALACFGLLAALPWLGTKFVPAGLVVGAYAAVGLWRARRRALALAGVEIAALSAVAYAVVNDALYGGLTPYAADTAGESATDADIPLGYAERAYRLAALLVDRDYGLFRWAPVLALVAVGAWLLHRGRRQRLAHAVPGHREAEVAAALCAGALLAQLGVAAFLAPTMFGFWFPGRHVIAAVPLAVPLVAWGLRRLPRTGTALALIGVAASAWLYLDVRLGDAGLVTVLPDAPWGPLEVAFPFFGDSPVPYAISAALTAALAALALRESRHSRQTAGATRARYSG